MIKTQQRPVAVVTGASSGIGLAIAQHLSKAGYDLALCARRHERLVTLAKSLEANGSKVLIQAVDLRDEAQILSFFTTIDEQFGRLDALINNAGLGHKESLMTGRTDAWREMLEVNVLALCICTREAVQRMKAADSGHIVNISSMSGHRVPAITGIYSATKFAVRSLSETLRRELRAAQSNIRISSVSPGIVETEFAEKYHQSAEKAQETYGQFSVLQAADIAKSVIYILQQPQHVEVNDILIRPSQQSS
ncbi:KR domain superfamily [Synechococcus sp. PCC 7335]|uniref:SDR family NAD(P)-dependent oxidoreductase n=1 Tax=Synechococcus sp. (strain ATCC 29403 / PCC 7335) TaxID=91464 RepID=UPI00017ED9AD|nr:SDR family NAD(P)-dependent oxidoreductase [Synechococcus sp. PCC 7335]EDX85385.1 KR domain superfamily [Synechococcus sp. PCC 7335]